MIINDDNELFARAAIGENIDDGKFVKHREIAVQTRNLNSILEEAGAKEIDLLSIDVEGAELEVLLVVDLQKYKPRLILLEDKHLYLTKHRYLKKNNYRLVKRTRQNCWYIPKGVKRPIKQFLKNLESLRECILVFG